MKNEPDELEDFKSRINLTEFAAAEGYVLDRRASSRASAAMKHPAGDKIIISRGPDGHWIYFSVRDTDDHGSIIDFVQRRGGASLGQVRQALRPWIGREPLPIREEVASSVVRLRPGKRDPIEVMARYAVMRDINGHHPYLETERMIPAAILSASCFRGRIRKDRRGNAIFPHFNRGGLCGYEVKNRDFTGFSPGGAKGLWFGHPGIADHTIVIAETAVDALSHAALKGTDGSRFVSIAGQMNRLQPALLAEAVQAMPPSPRVILAFDNDGAGAALAAQVREILETVSRDDLRVIDDRPPNAGDDWNDVLRIASFPPPQPEPY